jgi:Insertion element 4 transposase N-terminal/Transposase DDE domain
MNFRPRSLGVEDRFCEAVTLETLTRVVPVATIAAVIEEVGVREQRVRKLPAGLTVNVLIGMCLYSHLSMAAVLQKMFKGLRLLWGDGEYAVANASALTQRRYQIGVRVMALLFRRVCQPLAQPQTRGAFLFGLRLMALDGTKEDVPDTPENAQVFGRHIGPKGGSAYPKALTVLLSECGTHAVVDAAFAPCYGSESTLGRRLLRSVSPGMLLMFDRGFYGFDMIVGAQQRGAQVLGRLAANVKPRSTQSLPDGSYLADIFPSETGRRKQGEQVRIRVVAYTFTDPNQPGYQQRHRVFTTLLDPQIAPAIDLVCAYHERWEVELVIDELQVHQRLVNHPLRSLKPRGVIQELYAILIAHYIVRAFMHGSRPASGRRSRPAELPGGCAAPTRRPD